MSSPCDGSTTSTVTTVAPKLAWTVRAGCTCDTLKLKFTAKRG